MGHRRQDRRGRWEVEPVLQELRTRPKQGVIDQKMFIDGKYVDAASGETFESRNPSTNEVIAKVAKGDASDVDRAVRAARKAFDEGPWPKMPVAERSAILMKVGAGIRKRLDELSELESMDQGKPIRESSHLDVPRSAYNFEFFAEYIKTLSSEANPVDDKFVNYTLREPVGVIAAISPWNFPLLLMTWKLGPALACGNAIVAKPASYTPLTTAALGEIMNEAGVPPGVFNVVLGPGGTVGNSLVGHKLVDRVSFTGETVTGATITAEAAKTLKDVSMELGGKAAAIVFADCDLELTIAQTIRAAYLNQGEVCLAMPRLLVERPIYDEFCSRFQKAAEALVLGDPLDHDTTMGPLVDRTHFKTVTDYIEIGKKEGAKVLFGGEKPQLPAPFADGNFLKPTALVGVNQKMRICQEEIFGPVVTIQPFDTEAEAVAIANDVKYGLAGTVFTTNLSKAHRVARNVRAGLMWVNCWFVRDLRTPFGGMKESGIGREGGVRSIEFYSEIKNVCIAL
jgi:aminomuconate-semialdehyde/2-hydroxymuconate-6-semialdehyde dehydrogenase